IVGPSCIRRHGLLPALSPAPTTRDDPPPPARAGPGRSESPLVPPRQGSSGMIGVAGRSTTPGGAVLIHPWDASTQEEWSAWIAAGRDFGTLVANGDGHPVVVPTHFVHHDGRLLVHLARPNPMHAAVS